MKQPKRYLRLILILINAAASHVVAMLADVTAAAVLALAAVGVCLQCGVGGVFAVLVAALARQRGRANP